MFSWSPIKYNSYYCFTSLHTILVFVIIFFFSFSPLYQENRPKKTSVQCQMCSHLGRIKLKNTAPSVTCFPGDLLFLPTNVMADNNSRFDYLPTMDELLNTVENKVQLNSKYHGSHYLWHYLYLYLYLYIYLYLYLYLYLIPRGSIGFQGRETAALLRVMIIWSSISTYAMVCLVRGIVVNWVRG